tara:strand:- start:3062 stop:4999 length:1938 start_codon:yes stop_codon:yes gene_type:complete
MALLRTFYTNFTGGEVTPLLSSRIDTEAYQNGAKQLRNVRIRSQGGVTRRPGTLYLQTLTNTDYQVEPYVYDEDEAYIILFRNTVIDIVDASSPTTIVDTITSAPYTTAMLGNIRVAQSGDTMIITHPDVEIKKLTRTSANNFSLDQYVFDTASTPTKVYQPYHKFVAASTFITPSSASAGSITLTASANTFLTNHVNQTWRFVDSAGKVVYALITGYTNFTTATATLYDDLANTNIIYNFGEPVFSALRGYARTCIFHDQRLIFGGSKSLPNHMFMSKVSEFFNFDVGTSQDADAIQFQIAENQVSEIKSLASLRHLTVFTSEQELYVPTSENKPLTPATVTIKKQTNYGSGAIQPEVFDGAIVYATKSLGAIREFVFSDISQAYNSDALTIVSQDTIGTPSKITAQQEASDQIEGYLYMVNTDGDLSVFMSIRKEKLQAWSKYTTTGTIKNIVNVNRQIYLVVQRTFNSTNYTMLERLDNTCFLDCSKKFTSSPSNNEYSVSHLAHGTVYVRSGNYSLGEHTVSSGGVCTTTETVGTAEIGLNFTPTIQTLPPEFQLQEGVTVGEKRRIVRAVLDLYESLSITAKGTEILVRNVTDDLSTEPSKITARKEVYLLGWSTDGTVTVTSSDPLPLTVNGIMLEVEI